MPSRPMEQPLGIRLLSSVAAGSPHVNITISCYRMLLFHAFFFCESWLGNQSCSFWNHQQLPEAADNHSLIVPINASPAPQVYSVRSNQPLTHISLAFCHRAKYHDLLTLHWSSHSNHTCIVIFIIPPALPSPSSHMRTPHVFLAAPSTRHRSEKREKMLFLQPVTFLENPSFARADQLVHAVHY